MARHWPPRDHGSWTPQVPPVRPAWPFLGGALIGAVIVMLVFCSPIFFL